MITRNTTIILGAGASKPYGFPLGFELRDEILKAKKKFEYTYLLENAGISATDHEQFSNDLATSGFSSVDAFLEQRPKWTNIGKSAMAICLLAAEINKKSRLFPPKQPKDHWYQVLWSQLKAPSLQAFKKQPLNIVTFNYDRSLEHYLVQVISNNYSIKPRTAINLLPIIHVHGSLGAYDPLEFGNTIDNKVHSKAVDSIRVVHEADVKNSEFVHARRLISEAERTLFIGFGYLDTNMRKLGFGKDNHLFSNNSYVLGTHKGIKPRTWRHICDVYKFSTYAKTRCGGNISDLISEWLF